jgi:hypothetical protein
MNEAVELLKVNNQRLQMAAKVASGICANPGGAVGGDWRRHVALDAWDIAGKLQQLAISGGV